MRLQALKLAMFCAIATHISAKYETRAPEGRVANPNPNRVSADEGEIREKRSLLSRRRKAVKKNATFNLSDIEKRLRDVEQRYFFKLFCSILTQILTQILTLFSSGNCSGNCYEKSEGNSN